MPGMTDGGSLGFIILWFAAARLRAVMMPANVLSAAAELAYLLGHSNSKVAFTLYGTGFLHDCGFCVYTSDQSQYSRNNSFVSDRS